MSLGSVSNIILSGVPGCPSRRLSPFCWFCSSPAPCISRFCWLLFQALNPFSTKYCLSYCPSDVHWPQEVQQVVAGPRNHCSASAGAPRLLLSEKRLDTDLPPRPRHSALCWDGHVHLILMCPSLPCQASSDLITSGLAESDAWVSFFFQVLVLVLFSCGGMSMAILWVAALFGSASLTQAQSSRSKAQGWRRP